MIWGQSGRMPKSIPYVSNPHVCIYVDANYVDATNLSFVKYFLYSYIPVYLQHFVVQPVY